MSAIGISLGIATLILVTAIPASGQAHLDERLNALGADVLVAQAAESSPGTGVKLPRAAAAMVDRVGGVEVASGVANLNKEVLRTNLSDPNDTAGITALAASPNLLTAVHGRIAEGRFLDVATERLPTVVLGNTAASWLGITTLNPLHPLRIMVGSAWLTVVGILAPMPLTPELEQAVFVGWDAARHALGFNGDPTVVYLRADESKIGAVTALLAPTLDPALPGLVSVSRPSDALAAKQATESTFSGLFLGLAAVALVVGGIGVANTMIVSVLERRREIGLRRALGATRHDIRGQFLTEAILLSLLGGIVGITIGILGGTVYALSRGWPAELPLSAIAAGAAGAVVIGALAGLYPAVRASRLSPTEALASA
jgi:putative ABC transport system permease protein